MVFGFGVLFLQRGFLIPVFIILCDFLACFILVMFVLSLLPMSCQISCLSDFSLRPNASHLCLIVSLGGYKHLPFLSPVVILLDVAHVPLSPPSLCFCCVVLGTILFLGHWSFDLFALAFGSKLLSLLFNTHCDLDSVPLEVDLQSSVKS